MSTRTSPSHGLLAIYDSVDGLMEAARRARAEGYTDLDAFTPFPVEGLAEIVGFRPNRVATTTLLGAVLGGLLGFYMQYYSAVIDYPINVGGMPYNSWPAFMVVTFELTILGGAVGAFVSLLVFNGLPRLHHPLFEVEEFQLASRNRFFLLIGARDPRFDAQATRAWLASTGAKAVREVPG